MAIYEEILNQAMQLSSEERLQLANALLEEEFGFGMWLERTEMTDVAAYVEQIREADIITPVGQLKAPEDYLKEVEAFDE
jgi:hypothetical protein